MPAVYACRFQVRHYECDALGRLYHANLLRYFQEAAFDASASAGYSLARYREMDRIWLVRETELHICEPLLHGEQAEVKTWVDDFRRVRSRRAYEMRRTRDGALVASAVTDWAFLDRRSGRPAAIPVEMMRAFFPEGAPPPGPPRTRSRRQVSIPAEPPAHAFVRERSVNWSDMDPAHHVNNAAFLAYLEDIEVADSHRRGWSLERLQAQGLEISARYRELDYVDQARVGDRLEVATWLTGVEAAQVTRCHLVRRLTDGAHVLEAWSHQLCTEAGSGAPVCLPAGYLREGEHAGP